MWDIIKEVTEAASAANITISQLSLAASNELRKKVFSKFPLSGEQFAFPHSEAWRWSSEFIKDNAVFFVPKNKEPIMFQISKPEELTMILENSFAFEFFVTNYELDYLLFYNHHNYLIAFGTAIEWLKIKVEEIKKN